MKTIFARLKREPVAIRGLLTAALNLLVVGGVVDTGAATEYEVIVLAALNLLLFKGARDRVTPIDG